MWPRLRAAASAFEISTVVEGPVTGELGAGGLASQAGLDARPARPAVTRHVIVGDAIGDALIAEGRHQPIEQGGGVVPLDSRSQTALMAAVGVSEEFGVAGQSTNPLQQAEWVVAIGAGQPHCA